MEADFMSLVKPSCSETIADLDFANLLNKDDLPTFVLPTSATVILIYFRLNPTRDPSMSCANNLSEKMAI